MNFNYIFFNATSESKIEELVALLNKVEKEWEMRDTFFALSFDTTIHTYLHTIDEEISLLALEYFKTHQIHYESIPDEAMKEALLRTYGRHVHGSRRRASFFRQGRDII